MSNKQPSNLSESNGTHAPRMVKVDVRSGPVRMLLTDSLSGLKKVESGSVQVAATSPPFYLLRNYGTNALTWPDGWVGELGHGNAERGLNAERERGKGNAERGTRKGV
jgi:hypothetical protein